MIRSSGWALSLHVSRGTDSCRTRGQDTTKASRAHGCTTVLPAAPQYTQVGGREVRGTGTRKGCNIFILAAALIHQHQFCCPTLFRSIGSSRAEGVYWVAGPQPNSQQCARLAITPRLGWPSPLLDSLDSSLITHDPSHGCSRVGWPYCMLQCIFLVSACISCPMDLQCPIKAVTINQSVTPPGLIMAAT